MPRAFIALGSNINPAENMRAAIRLLGRRLRILRVSTCYETAPEGRPDQPPFYNAVVEVETDVPPAELKQTILRGIEDQLGRKRGADRYAPRTIDLDLLVYDDLRSEAGDLVLPDPLIVQRAFLAVPLAQLAPDMVLPGSNSTMAEIAAGMTTDGMLELVAYTDSLRRELEDGS